MTTKKVSQKVAKVSRGTINVAMSAEAAPAEPTQAGTTEASAPPNEGEAAKQAPAEAGGAAPLVLVPATGVRFELRQARRAFEAVQGALLALVLADLLVVRVDLQKMAVTVLSLIGRDAAPARRAVFERYAAQGNYDVTLFDRLPVLALAAWYVRRQQLRAIFVGSGAAVSKEQVAQAYEVRTRMLTVLEHWHGDRPEVAVELAQVREGSGHQDLANDLDTLAEMYERADLRPLIEHDIKHYRAGDADEALRLATILASSLGITDEGEAERLTNLARRSATLLVNGYEEHARCGRFFFGKTEDVAVTYPSLFAAVRAPQRKRSTEEPVGEGEPVDEAPVEEPEEDPVDEVGAA